MAGRRKLHEEVMGEVLAAIVSGEHAEGGRLPKETALAERHGVSRYVARECIQALRDRGVITVKHGVGATVAPRSEWNLFDPVLLDAMLAGPEAQAVAAEIREARRMVWPEVAAAAARRHTAAELERLEAAGDDPHAFHAALLEAAGNRFLRHVLAGLDRTAPDPDADAQGLGSVLDGVASRDEDAARAAMRDRLERPARTRSRKRR